MRDFWGALNPKASRQAMITEMRGDFPNSNLEERRIERPKISSTFLRDATWGKGLWKVPHAGQKSKFSPSMLGKLLGSFPHFPQPLPRI